MKTILFDLDGTLIDTEPSAIQATQACFESWNMPLALEDIQYVTGRTWESAYQYFFSKFPDLPVPKDEVRRLINLEYRRLIEENLCIVPGGTEAVGALAEDFQLGLVSGSYRKEILWALKKLNIEHHFKIILGAEDYPRSKPHPDGYLKALEILGEQPETCLIFEDSLPGIQSGLTAGAWVVAITSTNHFEQDQSGAHHHIPDLTCVNTQWVRELKAQLRS